MKVPAKLIVIASVLGVLLLSYKVKSLNDADEITTSLHTWFQDNPQEKIYLHTDKPYYLVGDTIWLKAYVTIGSDHQLSALSGAVYIELINETDSLTKLLKLPLISGMATANLILQDSVMKEGNYRIRAYTEWMRNSGPDYFYDRTFSIGNSTVNKVFTSISYNYSTEGNKTQLKATIKYSDNKLQPYANKNVRYELKESYKILASGSGKTSASGEIVVRLPIANIEKISSQHLSTHISITSIYKAAKTFPIKVTSLQPDVQFFPEGGDLVNGIKSKVAFKAIGTDGLGVAVSGVISDNESQEVANIETKHLGMGVFHITPEAGKSYMAKLNYADGSKQTINLRAAVSSGYSLSVSDDLLKDSLVVKISAGPEALNAIHMVTLIGQSGGKAYFSLPIPIRSKTTTVHLPLAEIPSGIMQFTLFSNKKQPLNERIIFITNKDRINLQVTSVKQVYQQKEKVELDIEATSSLGEPIGGNFSVAVISESAVPTDETNENSILSQLLLTSDIKGYVEKPNYYFHKESAETKSNLDLLMLTQGYRRFTWNQILVANKTAPSFKAEPMVNAVSGKLLTFSNKPVAGGKVTLMNNKINLLLDTVTDQNGIFKFGSLFITDGLVFTIQGKNAKGGNRLKVEMDKISQQAVTPNKSVGDLNINIPSLIQASVGNGIKQDLEIQKHGGISRDQQLREVQIIRSKPWTFGNKISESQADEMFRPDSRKPCKNLMECMAEAYNTQVRFESKLDTSENSCGVVWVPKGFVILIDDMLILSPCDYQSILLDDASKVDRIFISYQSPAVAAKLLTGHLYKFKGRPPAVMAIYTKNGNFRYNDDPSVVQYHPKGYDYTKEFYSPKYGEQQSSNDILDFRSTIYWNPAVLTKASGQSKVSYFNANQTGTYRVVVEGIDGQGRLGRQVYRYKVE